MDRGKLDHLLTETGKGNNGAFAEFYRQTVKGVYVFAYSYVKERTLAEDLAQDTYVAVKQKAYTYKPGTNPRAWLLQITKNLAIDELRRQKRAGGVVSDERILENAARCFLNDGTALSYMLEKLDDEKREIVILHVFWGYKHREIADMLKMPLGTVLWKYNEALKQLKQYGEKQ